MHCVVTTVGDVPAAVHHGLVGRNVVAHQAKDHHHHVIRHGDRVAERDFSEWSMAASRSTWSLPMPAVMAIFRLRALSMRLHVMYAERSRSERGQRAATEVGVNG